MPKNTKGNANNAKPAGKKGGGASLPSGKDFDALLGQLAKETKAVGVERKKSQKDEHVTNAERKARFHQRQAEMERSKTSEMDKAIEQRMQQQKVQQLLQEMMQARQGGNMQSPFLNEPNTKVSTESKAGPPAAGTAEMQGWRRAMEDAHNLFPSWAHGYHLYSVMDGHGGSVAATTIKAVLPAVMMKHIKDGMTDDAIEAAMVAAYAEMDQLLLSKHGGAVSSCGTTCVTVLISDKKIHCASVGDSRAVLGRASGLPLAWDHKPENEAEERRIVAGGGHVANNRVNGNLAMSRALGDYMYKEVKDKPSTEQLVINVPDVYTVDRSAEDEFVVLACDGIFDVLSNDEVVAFVRDEMNKVRKAPTDKLTAAQLEEVAAAATRRCLAAPGEGGYPATAAGTDNMTITVVQL